MTTGESPEPVPPREEARRFRTVGVFDGEPDLGRACKQAARHERGDDGLSGKPEPIG